MARFLFFVLERHGVAALIPSRSPAAEMPGLSA